MIKKIVLVATFFIFNNVNSQNDIIDTTKYKIVYNLIYQQDSTNIASKREEKMVLFIGKKYSLFQSENSRFNDSLVNYYTQSTKLNEQTALNTMLSVKKKSRFNFKILKSPNTMLVFDKIFSDKFIYKDEEKLNWKILNETKQINNYLCQKAITHFAGRNYVAWFTSKIPINDGPYKFRGLPGLIIKIQDTKKQYVFELLSLKKYNSSFLFDVKGIQMVTKEAYFKAYNDFKNNFIKQLEQRGIVFDKSNANQVNQSIRKRRNNEIEID
jgi:GLPGLI family protein